MVSIKTKANVTMLLKNLYKTPISIDFILKFFYKKREG